MNLEHWQMANNDDLASRLASLRQRLTEHIPPVDRPQPIARFDPSRAIDRAVSEEPSRSVANIDRPEPALEILGRLLGLSAFERDVLFLCVAMELDTQIAGLCGLAQRDLSRSYPTFALAMSLFDSPEWSALSPERPLRKYRLVEMTQPGATPLTAAALRADERIVNFVKGLNECDARLTPLFLDFDADLDVVLTASQSQLAAQITELILPALPAIAGPQRLPVVQLTGADSADKQLIARHVAAGIGLNLVRLSWDVIPTDTRELETFLQLWERESRLLPLGLYLDASEADVAGIDRPVLSPLRFLARASGLVFIETLNTHRLQGRPSLAFDVEKTSRSEQQQLWDTLLPEGRRHTGRAVAGQFNLSVPAIHGIAGRIAADDRRRTASSGTDDSELWSMCRSACRPRLDTLARRIEGKATWDDLVLPPDELRRLREIADQVRFQACVYDDWGFRGRQNRGFGISVLFAGESGTGKTMAAEVIANDLQLDLYRIDLSAVVNKYIGETEKNLRRLFDAADDGGAILFFDEADSLFGKRTEVKDSHDRYANLEVNYLLQRMESYRGLAILATNLRDSLDKAFLRRLRFVVDFPLPEYAQRRELWQNAFPAGVPLDDLDWERLARLHVSGGNINTIALNASFASAGAGSAVTMSQVLDAARAEYRKLQKPVNAADFRTVESEGVVVR